MSGKELERQSEGGPPPSTGGMALVTVLVLAVAAWMAFQRPQPESAVNAERFSGLTASFGRSFWAFDRTPGFSQMKSFSVS